MRNHEVTRKQMLLDQKGEIAEPGWAKSQVWKYRRKDIKAPAFRIKEWDYYLVMGRDFAGAFTLSDDGYIGLQSVSLLNLNSDNPWEHTETVLNMFPLGKMHMPENSSVGDIKYQDKRLKMSFTIENETRHIVCHFKNFWKGKDFKCNIILQQKPMDTMVIATPWDQKHAFYYNQKMNCMRASGYMEYDGVRYEFHPETDFGTLDWGRGVWTYDNTWRWGSGNCQIKGKAFGFNIGYGFGNTKAATENIIFYDGKAHKLDDVKFIIPKDDYCKPWKFVSSDSRFEMNFNPILDRAAKMSLGLIASDQHQVFGRMTGHVILDDGTKLEVKDMLCFAEKVHNRY